MRRASFKLWVNPGPGRLLPSECPLAKFAMSADAGSSSQAMGGGGRAVASGADEV